MANATSSDAMTPGRAALAGRPSITIAAPDGSNTGLRVEEIVHLGKLNIRGGKAIASIIKTHTGCDFPPANNKVNSTGARHVVWLGPDETLLLCEAGLEVRLYRQINAAFADQHAAIINVTDGYCALRLTGGGQLEAARIGDTPPRTGWKQLGRKGEVCSAKHWEGVAFQRDHFILPGCY